jgi:hypothetical protein
MKGVAGAIALLLALIAPLMLGGAIAWREETPPDSVRTPSSPVVTEAQARTILDERPAAAGLEQREGASLLAPAWSGLVVASSVGPGTVLTTGSPIANVAGVLRLAASTAHPFYRPLQTDDTGADVEELNQLLVTLGHLAELPNPPSRFTLATGQGVRSLERDLGIAEPSGVFDPGWLVWLPFEPFEVGESFLVSGAPAPAPGQPVAKAPSLLLRATLTAANHGDVLALEPAVKWVFVSNRQRFGVDALALELDQAALPEVQKLLKPKQERLDGIVQRAEPLNVVAIPSTAVQVGPSGDLCVWVPEGTGYRPVPIRAGGARAGVTNVTEGLIAGTAFSPTPPTCWRRPSVPRASRRRPPLHRPRGTGAERRLAYDRPRGVGRAHGPLRLG